ncbi:carbohydrate ABC transporter permease [Streptomyces specialis]|uniref:carbohydrate ABC transporter permease n=1 Tax=Streptomyces specialis TaxID=498367 RepID=UPI00073EC556|nr:sugar ABC transporter permease [Streptomyces specialis]
MMAPGLLLLAALSILPFAAVVAMSFSRVHLLGGLRLEAVGADNWSRLLDDPDMAWVWARTAGYFAVTVGTEMVLGTVLAVFLWRLRHGRNTALSLLLLPMFVAPVIVGLLGRFLTDSTFGLYAWLLEQAGYSGDVMADKTTAFAAVTLMDVWEWTPLVTLIALAGLTSVPASVLEAASLDGAGTLRTLRHIVLPSIAPVLLVALLIRSMDALRYFDIIWNTTGGGPADATKTASIRLYETAFRFFDFGYAAVTGLLMLAVTTVVARYFVRLLDRNGTPR